MGKEEEDEVKVKLPNGEVDYEIVSICYKDIELS
jgi:transcription elongation GreA/GreB family factor